MSGTLLRYHRVENNFRAALEEAVLITVSREAIYHYAEMRISGESRKLATMLALREGPALRTDSEFRKGHTNGNQFESCAVVGNTYRRLADRAGVSTTGKIYLRGLARYPGDPSAWVGGRGDVQKIAEDRGWGVSGAVNVQRREVESMPDVAIGPDIVAQAAAAMRSRDPDLSVEQAHDDARQLRAGASDDSDLRVSWPEGEAAQESQEIM